MMVRAGLPPEPEPMLLRGYKAIAEYIERVVRVPVTPLELCKYASWATNPLPVIRVRQMGATRGVVFAEPAKIEEWARKWFRKPL